MLRQVVILAGLTGCLLLTSCDKETRPPASGPAGTGSTPAAPGTPTNVPVSPKPAAQPPATAGGPRWACDKPVIDFGSVWETQIVKQEFTFRNVGNAALVIEDTRPRCSCSTTPNYTKEVPPGGTGVIPYVLDTTDKPNGRLEEYVTLETNDPVNRAPKVTLVGNIRTVLTDEVVFDALYDRDLRAGKTPPQPPHQLLFGQIQAMDRLQRTVRLKNTSGRPLTVTMQPPPPNSRFKADFKETVPGQEFELTVSAEPPFPVGYTNTNFEFATNAPEKPIYKLQAWAQVPPRVEISPQKIVYDLKKFAKPDRTIKIANHGSTPINVLSISTSEPRLDIRLLPPDPKNPGLTTIAVNIPGGGYQLPAYCEFIDITTDDRQYPLIHIPLAPTMEQTSVPRPADKPLVMQPVPLVR